MIVDVQEQRAQICAMFKRIYDRGLTTATGGNLSLKTDHGFLCSPAGMDKGKLREEDYTQLSPVNLKNPLERQELVYQGPKPTSETRMHLGIYSVRADATAIIHAHPPHVSAVSLLRTPMPLNLLSEAAIVLRTIRYVPYAAPSTHELAKNVTEAAKECDVLILRNHGAVLVGKTLIDCFQKLEVLEHTAFCYLQVIGRKDVLTLDEAQMSQLDGLYR